MDDLPARLADSLESVATKVRTLTVERVAYWTKVGALALVAASLGLMAFIFILIGLFRLLSSVIGVTPTYAVLSGLFVIIGAFLWVMRTRPPKDER